MSVGSIGSSGPAQLSSIQTRQVTTLQQIGSGERIVRAGIDPAGAAVLAELDTETASQRAAIRNSNDGMSILQTAESAASSSVDQLQRLRELAMQAASGTTSQQGRDMLQREADSILEELDAQADRTEFNGIKVADGSLGAIDVQTGTGSGDQTEVELLDLTTGGLGLGSIDLSSAAGAQNALDAIDSALDNVNEQRSGLGASQNRLESAIAYGEQAALNTEAAASQIGDTDFLSAAMENSNQSVQQKAAIFAMTQARNINRVAVQGLL